MGSNCALFSVGALNTILGSILLLSLGGCGDRGTALPDRGIRPPDAGGEVSSRDGADSDASGIDGGLPDTGSCGCLDGGDAGAPQPDAASWDASPMVGTMVRVPEGLFAMGCNTAADTECGGDEKPSPKITLSDFEIDATEVAQSSYQACVAASVCQVPACDFEPATRGTYPVACVTWDQAALFCAWAGKRLPTEAEWEKAARGTDGRIYPWGNQAPDCARANLFGCGGSSVPVSGPVGGASPYGALHMAGNVWEWVNDYYEFDYYKRSPAKDPQGPPQGHDRAKRGGGAADAASLLRTSQRDGIHPSKNGKLLGFRCARSPP